MADLSPAVLPTAPNPPENQTNDAICIMSFNALDATGALGLTADSLTIASVGAYPVSVACCIHVGSRTIGYLKTSVRCCMAERYFEKFWQHGKPVPRSCHADQSS